VTPALSLKGITCTFVSRDDRSQRYTAVQDVTLDIAPGEFVSVVGPTGCARARCSTWRRACWSRAPGQ